MMSSLHTRISADRMAVLIGPGGTVKKKIEELAKVTLEINSETGELQIQPTEQMEDPTMLFKARDIVTAIGRGFPPQKAFQLIEDNMILDVIDLRDIAGKRSSEINRFKGRIIGTDGKTRRIIEETTDTDISIYGYTVSIVGPYGRVQIAKNAVERLIKGNERSSVYRYLIRLRQELKEAKLKIWEDQL